LRSYRIHEPFTIGFAPRAYVSPVTEGSRNLAKEGRVMTVLLRNTFKAWIDRAPGAPPKLVMVGDVRVPTNGWHARLTKRSPQGINPKILILDVSALQPDGAAQEEKITTIPLRYEESPPQDEYGQVMIATCKGEIVVHVGRTH
jgi:hypothetical protein